MPEVYGTKLQDRQKDNVGRQFGEEMIANIWVPKDITDESEWEEDKLFATRKAQQFMKVLFGGDMPVRCTCGEPVKFRKNRLRCDCGKRLNRVEYEDDYNRWIIKTVIDIDRKEFWLERNDTPDIK
jgi:hypothetical protein